MYSNSKPKNFSCDEKPKGIQKMNMFTSALNAPTLRPIVARTENGMRARTTTSSAALDLFGSIGAMRGKDVIPAFKAAYYENLDLALRIAQWARDVRGGSGERQLYRDILLFLENENPDLLLQSRLLDNLPELGRFDDLFIFTKPEIKARAYQVLIREIRAGNGLAAKWAPRKGQVAVELRNAMGLTPKQYRKLIVGLTNVVETNMCAQNWNEINFSHVPSLAMTKYMTAFHRNAPEHFTAYKEALKRNDGSAKVNAGAVYPHDVVKALGGAYQGYGRSSGNEAVADAMWKALPDYMNGKNVLSMVDVSGSMTSTVGGSSTLTCMDVAVSLGLYVSDKSKGAFKDLFLTFSGSPEFVQVKGSLSEKISKMVTSQWAMNTNLHAAFDKILNHAVRSNVPVGDMPEMLLILSDMQFDSCTRFDDSAMQMIRRKYENAGYEMPQVVFWNLRDAGNKPVHFRDNGVALVSGFSPSIMESILAVELEKFTPEAVMLKAVGKDRYAW
jgi:hypothetical protein